MPNRACFLFAFVALWKWSDMVLANEYDTSQDWVSDLAAYQYGCIIQPPVNPNATLPTCRPASRNLTDEELDRLGPLLAPKLYLHPLDWSHLTDQETWMKESMAFYNETWDGPKTFQQLEDHHAGSHEGIGWAWDNVIGPRTFGSALWTNGSFTNTTFLTDGIKQKLAGDPVVGGLATGKVWYTVMKPEVPGTPRGDHVAFVYGYFFPWNGCSNQLLSVIIDDKFYGAEYYKCASDVHEGDLEHTKSLACTQDLIELLDSPDPRVNATSLVRRVQMSQHSWIQELDCEKDECPAETGDDGITRLIAYSALHSHAVYPKASPLQVYRAAQANAVTSGGGLYIADRTSADGPVFVPNTTNTQRVPYAAQMNDTERAYFSWALYPGGIGSNDMIKGANSSIVCLYGNITSVGPCPSSNPAVHFIVKALELSGDYVQHNKDVVYMFDGDVDAEVPLQGMTSLLFRTFAYKWPIGGSQAPVVGTNTSCPFTVRLTLSEVTYDVTSSTNLGAFIGTILGLMVGFGIVYTIMLFFPGIEDRDLTINIPNLEKSMDSGAGKLTADPGYSFSKTTLPCESAINGKSKPVFFVQRSLLWLGTAVILYIAGLTMCVVGFYDLFQALDELYDSTLWEDFNAGFIAVMAVFGSLQLITLILVLFLRSQQFLLGCVDCRNPCARCPSVDRGSFVFQALYNGLLVVQINVTICVFGLGLMFWTARYLFQKGCNSVFTNAVVLGQPLGDTCVDLTVIGLSEKALCGAHLAKVCNFWDSLQVQYLLWGSYCFLMSHLLFLGALIHNMHTLPELSSSQRKAKEEAIAAAQLKQSRHHEILMSTPLNEGYAIVAV